MESDPNPDAAAPLTCGFNHVATLTTDLDRFAAFHHDVFAAQVTFRMDAADGHPKMYVIDLVGGAALNVFEVLPDDILGERHAAGARGAIDHFGIAVDSLATLEAVRQRLLRADADIGEAHQLGDTWSLFFRDVDGMELEVCAPLD